MRTISIEKQTLAPAGQKQAGEKSGLKAEHYKGVSRKVSDLDGKTPDEVEYIASPQKAKHRVEGYVEVYPEDFYSTILTGYIDIPNTFFNEDSYSREPPVIHFYGHSLDKTDEDIINDYKAGLSTI